MRRLIFALFSLCLFLLCVTARADAPTLTDRIAAVLLALPRHTTDADEDPGDRSVRMREIATAVSAATAHATCAGAWKRPDCQPRWTGSRLELASVVLAIGTAESTWARYTATPAACSAGPKSARCDSGPDGKPRARTYWQLWHSAAPDVWETEPGSDAELRLAAWAATRLLAGGYAFCRTQTGRDPWDAAIAYYSGRGCREWPGTAKRISTMRRIRRDLEHAVIPPADAQPWPAEPKLP